MRLAIVGKTRSGKSTALHRFLSHALRHPWAGVILLDGKGSELPPYVGLKLGTSTVMYYGPEDVELWAAALEAYVERMAERYKELKDSSRSAAPPDAPKWLIVADEVQKGTRHDKHGKSIRKSLTEVSEQSAALGDVLIISTQREITAIPPSARHNFNIWLRMLNTGYYYLSPDGQPSISGRIGNLTSAQSLELIRSGATPLPFVTNQLFDILGSAHVTDTRAPATLYTGVKGSGKTWRLHHHTPSRTVSRRIYVDFAQPHRAALTILIESAGAIVPPRVAIPQLVEICALALQSEPTLLLIDNLDLATTAMLPTVDRLITAASECALSTKTPQTNTERSKLQAFIARVKIVEIKPLTRAESLALAHKHLPDVVTDLDATERRILELGNGHPATITALAVRTQRGSLDEVRHYASHQHAPVNLGWLLVFPIFFLLLLWHTDGYVIAAFGLLALFVVKRLAVRQLRFL